MKIGISTNVSIDDVEIEVGDTECFLQGTIDEANRTLLLKFLWQNCSENDGYTSGMFLDYVMKYLIRSISPGEEEFITIVRSLMAPPDFPDLVYNIKPIQNSDINEYPAAIRTRIGFRAERSTFDFVKELNFYKGYDYVLKGDMFIRNTMMIRVFKVYESYGSTSVDSTPSEYIQSISDIYVVELSAHVPSESVECHRELFQLWIEKLRPYVSLEKREINLKTFVSRG